MATLNFNSDPNTTNPEAEEFQTEKVSYVKCTCNTNSLYMQNKNQYLHSTGWATSFEATPYTSREMTIQVTSDKIIRDLQHEFNNVFPYLKIEFFRKGSRFRQSSQRDTTLPTQLSIGGVYHRKFKATINITPSMTVKELEKTCEEQFGILVQVYRKSGNMWLETTMTENWTIKQQNDSGSEISVL